MSSSLFEHRRWSSLIVLPQTSEVDVDRALDQATRFAYQGIQIDLTKAVSSNRELIVRNIVAASEMGQLRLPVLLRVNANELREFKTKDPRSVLLWNVIVKVPGDEALAEEVAKIAAKDPRVVVSLKTNANVDLERLKALLLLMKAQGLSHFQMEFPFASSGDWREDKIEAWLKNLSEESELEALPPIGWGLDDPDLSNDDQIFPAPETILRQNESQKIKLSVIIPTFERTVELTNTLRHLLRQSIPFSEFELIIVDCGSNDTTVRDTEKLLKSEGRAVAVTLTKIARPVRRRKGEIRYRAGLARNVGVSASRGRYLLFLDDDVLVPNDFLARVLAKLESSDGHTVFVSRCHSLSPDHFGVRMDYEKFQIERDTESPDRGFWRAFYERAANWMELSRPWRFLSTHTLALTKDLFQEAGWFRENYIAYTFEDMELGFHLARKGARFELLPIETFRQNRGVLPDAPRGRKARHKTLSRAAHVFYRHTLDRDVYRQVHQLFRKPLWFWLWYDYVKTLGPFWKFRKRNF